MDFKELIKTRQSDRKYRPMPVEKGKIAECLEAARLAPSACNSQPWKFVVIDEPAMVSEMAAAAKATGMNKFVDEVPVYVAVVLEKMNFKAKIGSLIKDKDYCMLDLGMAVEHFCLQAADLGLGTCIMGWFDEKQVSRLISAPRGKRIPLIIALGYPASETRNKIRKPLTDISSWGKY